MAQQNIIDVFDDCVNRMAAGQSLDKCLRFYPAHSLRLRPLLETGEDLRALRVPQTELLEDQRIVWQIVEQQLPARLNQRRPNHSPYRLLVLIILLLAALAVAWFVLTRPNRSSGENAISVPLVETSTETPTTTMTATATASKTATATPTASLTSRVTPTVTASPTATPTTTPSPTDTPTTTPSATHTATPTYTREPSQTLTPSPTFVPGCGAPLTADDAISRVFEVFPNTTVTSIQQTTKFGGTPVWEAKTSHQIEVNIDVACGYILTIVRENQVTPPTASGNGNDNVATPTADTINGNTVDTNTSDNANSNDNSSAESDDHDDSHTESDDND